MYPRFPNEILGLVVDALALKSRRDCMHDLLSCCLANRALRTCSQRHVFHTVILWPHSSPSDEDRELASQKGLSCPGREASLIREILGNPSLGLYVRRLDYRVTDSFPRNEDERLHNVLRVIELMPNITDFALGFSGISGGTYGPQFDRRVDARGPESLWKAAMRAAISRPELKTLRLSNIKGLHTSELAVGIEALHLDRAWFHYEPSVSAETPLPSIALKVLNCDSSSMLYLCTYLKGVAGGSLARHLHLPGVEILVMQSLFATRLTFQEFLYQAECLSELEFSLDFVVTERKMMAFGTSPLEHLRREFLNTLSRLKINVNVVLRKGHLEFLDPFAFLCNSKTFPKLTSLERLEIRIGLRGQVHHHHCVDLFALERWDSPLFMVAAPNLFPKLLRFVISMEVRDVFPAFESGGEDQNTEQTAVSRSQYAKGAKQHVRRLSVEMMQLMLDLHPKLDFSFKVDVL